MTRDFCPSRVCTSLHFGLVWRTCPEVTSTDLTYNVREIFGEARSKDCSPRFQSCDAKVKRESVWPYFKVTPLSRFVSCGTDYSLYKSSVRFRSSTRGRTTGSGTVEKTRKQRRKWETLTPSLLYPLSRHSRTSNLSFFFTHEILRLYFPSQIFELLEEPSKVRKEF